MPKKSFYFEQLTPLHPDEVPAPHTKTENGPKEKVPFDPWADLKPDGTAKVNVNPKLPGRGRVRHQTGKTLLAPKHVPDIGKLEERVAKIVEENPGITEGEVIAEMRRRRNRANSLTLGRLARQYGAKPII
jgi:hypothetical protein